MQIGSRFNPYKVFVGSFIPSAIMKTPLLSPSEKLLWARLNQYAGKSGICFPSQDSLAEEVGLSRRRVQDCLKILENQGFIKVQNPTGIDRLSHKTNRYIFLWHEIFEQNFCEIDDTLSPDESGVSAPDESVVSGGDESVVSKERGSILRRSEKHICPKADGLNLEEPDPSKLSPTKKKRIEVAFSKFWSSYPRKVNKSKALETFINRWGEMPPIGKLVATIKLHVASEEWKETKFIPHPTTWLNGRRWQDELTPKKSTGNYSDPTADDYAEGADMIIDTDEEETV